MHTVAQHLVGGLEGFARCRRAGDLALDNGFAADDDVAAVQAICGTLTRT